MKTKNRFFIFLLIFLLSVVNVFTAVNVVFADTDDERIAFDESYVLDKLIRPRTPRHNGKVERSHRNDNERFYKYLRFYSFEDLERQMAVYLRKSNNIPTSVLRSKFNKSKWLSPNEKERELLSA